MSDTGPAAPSADTQGRDAEWALAAIYEVFADTESDSNLRTAKLLELGCSYFGLGKGVLGRVMGEDFTVVTLRGPEDFPIFVGETLPLAQTFAGHTMRAGTTVAFEDADQSDLSGHPARTHLGIRCYLSAPVHVGDGAFGTMCFFGRAPRETPFADLERAIVRIMARWIGTELTRERSEQQLEDYRVQLRRLSSQVALAEERTRRTIASEIHDGLAQSLVGVRFKLASMKTEGLSSGDARVLADSRAAIDEAVGHARALASEISPPALYDLGLGEALEALGRRMGELHGLDIEVTHDGDRRRLPEDLRVVLYQSVRELLLNVVKHAHAGTVRVFLTGEGPRVRVVVEDDGKGMDPSDRSEPGADSGFGLFSISDRLDLFGGTFRVDTAPGKGFRATMFVPRHRSARPA